MSVRKVVEVYSCDLCGEDMSEGITLKMGKYKKITSDLEDSCSGAHICETCGQKIFRHYCSDPVNLKPVKPEKKYKWDYGWHGPILTDKRSTIA
jgi:hypothetical protein